MAASDSHFKSANGQTQKQPKLSVNGKEAQGECSVTVEESWDFNPFRSSSVVSIYRVPDILVSDRVKREAYVPTRVSLGPYHHKSAKLRSMNSDKERALQRMTNRFNDPNNMDFSFRATEEILNLQEKIRDNYEEKIDCNGETLGLMLTLDGCFILEILRTLNGVRLPEDGTCYEPLFEKERILNTGMDILNDMLKLENQIPFIVLLKLLKLQCSSTDSDAENELREMMRESFLPVFYPFQSKKGKLQGSWPQPHHHQEVHHLLGWLRIFIISPHSNNGEHAGKDAGGLQDQDNESGDIAHSQNGEQARNYDYMSISGQDEENAKINCLNSLSISGQDEENAKINCLNSLLPRICNPDKNVGTHDHIHRAIELRNAGIKLERCEGGIANIKFDESRNTIYLPRITVKDSTEILFRNLIAFEMCKLSEINYVACYVCLMDQLIDSEEDVALLRKRKIITNHLGSDAEVAKLFNGLCKGVNVNLEGAFDGLTEKVHNNYNNKFRVQLAELVTEYFSSPWKTLGLLGGIALLLLSIVQTIVAILALHCADHRRHTGII